MNNLWKCLDLECNKKATNVQSKSLEVFQPAWRTIDQTHPLRFSDPSGSLDANCKKKKKKVVVKDFCTVLSLALFYWMSVSHSFLQAITLIQSDLNFFVIPEQFLFLSAIAHFTLVLQFFLYLATQWLVVHTVASQHEGTGFNPWFEPGVLHVLLGFLPQSKNIKRYAAFRYRPSLKN